MISLALRLLRDYGFRFVCAICLISAIVANRNRTAQTAPRILRPTGAPLATTHVEESKKSRDVMIARKLVAIILSIFIAWSSFPDTGHPMADVAQNHTAGRGWLRGQALEIIHDLKKTQGGSENPHLVAKSATRVGHPHFSTWR